MSAGKPEDRVLVLAPTGKDAALIGEMLGKEGLPCEACRSAGELAAQIRDGGVMAIIAEEALIGVSLKPLITTLAEQPPWSDFPLLLLTNRGTEPSAGSARLLALFGTQPNITLLERPVRVTTLLSGVRSALRARRRQYEVREHLEERRRSNENLLQTQKLESLGVLAGGVAHDFNNLLTGILGNASLALDSLPPGCEPVRTLLEDVVGASERAAHLTKQLLAYAGKGRFVIEPVDLTSVVRAIVHLVQSSIPKNVRLILDLAAKLPGITGDKTQIQQIAMNLVINAAEAIPENRDGKVFVTTKARDLDQDYIQRSLPGSGVVPGRYVSFEVHDTGVGMDESTKARIFDPFFTTKFTGRGLGLAAVLGIVRSHNGALTVSSTPGRGSTFRVLFPASEAAEAAATAIRPVKAQPENRGRTILVIDDEDTVRRTAKASLERHGYDIILAENGNEGVEVFRALEGKISAVLLDLTMPGLNGEEVLGCLRKIRADVKVVLSSGFNEMEVIQRFTGQGLAGFIQKPYAAAALASKISEVLHF